MEFLGSKSSVEEAEQLFHDLNVEESGFLDATALLLVMPYVYVCVHVFLLHVQGRI